MTRRRKTDPLAQAIRDLRYLPRVLEALKALRAKDAEVMALVTPATPPTPLRLQQSDLGYGAETRIREQARREGRPVVLDTAVEADAAGRCGAAGPNGLPCRMAPFHSMEHCDREGRTWLSPSAPDHREMRLSTQGFEPLTPEQRADIAAGLNPRPAQLDTPERREYEAAKKAGTVIPAVEPPMTDAQRERMRQQREFVEEQRLAKGLPRTIPTPKGKIQVAEALMDLGAVPAARVEEIATVSGSSGPDDDGVTH